MPALRKPVFKIVYNGKNITLDISRFVTSITYTDKVVGESDEIDIALEDTDGRWRDKWYPAKGDKIKLQMGYEGYMLDCGEFKVDQVELSGPPHMVNIRGIASWVTSAMRTKDSYAHENKTLRQIAEYVASKNGLTVVGKIYTIRIARSTQDKEPDFAYLKRISDEFGYVFSVRGNQLVFTSVYDLEDGKPVRELDFNDLISYNITDKTNETFDSAVASYHDPVQNEVMEYKVETVENADNIAFQKIVALAKDAFGGAAPTLFVKTKAENKQQAELKAKAALHAANSKQQEFSCEIEGDPLMVAGMNFDLTGFGELSGRYHITQSAHNFNKDSGYGTSIEAKRVGYLQKVKQKPKKKRKPTPYTVQIVK
jgi:uncharacterized protein